MDTMQPAKAAEQRDDNNKEQTSKVVAPTDLKKAKATLLATPVETETKQRAEDQAMAAAELSLVTEKVVNVQAAESAIEDVLEIEREQVEAAAKSETETTSRAHKAEATGRALLPARLEMEAKVLEATPLESNAQEKAEPEVVAAETQAGTEAVLEVVQEQLEGAAMVGGKTVEATARALLDVFLDTEVKKRTSAAVACEQEKADEAEGVFTDAALEGTIVKEQDDKEQPPNVVAPASARNAEATAGMSKEQLPTVDIKKVAATARKLLTTLEARQRSKNQGALLATHLMMEAKQRADTTLALDQENSVKAKAEDAAFEIEKQAAVKPETEKARTRKAEANTRGLLATRLKMGIKQRAAAAAAFEQKKALEIEREAAVKAETEKARTRKAEANARGLLATRLDMAIKQRAVALEPPIVVASSSVCNVEATAGMSKEQLPTVDIEKVASTAQELLTTLEARQRSKNQGALLATRLMMEAKQRAETALALDHAKAVKAKEEDVALEIEQEAAVKLETEKARTRKAEANARGLLATRLKMEIKQRAAALEHEKALEIEREAAVRAETEKDRTRKAEANARGLLATRLDMEAKQRAAAALALAQEKALEIKQKAAVRAESEKARTRMAEANARGLLATRLEMDIKQRAAVAMVLAQEKALEIEREAVVRAEAEKARSRKAEANARVLLSTRLDMEAKQRAAAALALAQEKALEIEREAAIRVETEKARARKAEADARVLLATRLDMQARQRAKIHVTAVKEQNDREESLAGTSFKKAELDVKLQRKNQAATGVESVGVALEQTEQLSKVVAPSDIKKAEDTARSLLATCLEVEAKQRAKIQSTQTMRNIEEGDQVAEAEAAIEAVLEIATEAVLEIEQEQVEAAANAGLVAHLKKAESTGRVFLETRLEMAAKQRARRAAKATAVKKQEQPPAPTDVKKAEAASRAANARVLLATHLDTEARQRAEIHITAVKEQNDREESLAGTSFKKAELDVKLHRKNQAATGVESAGIALEQVDQLSKVVAPNDIKKAEDTARSLLATCLEVEAKQRAKIQSMQTTTNKEERDQVTAAEAAIQAVLEIATEAVLEIEQEQVIAANAGLVANIKKAESTGRVLLETRLEMVAQQ
jgi:hypothetical protein